MKTALRLLLWNGAFVAAIVLAALAIGDTLALALPQLLACWLLLIGAVFCRARGLLLAVAAVAGLLLLLQFVLLAAAVWWNRGFGHAQHETAAFVALAAALLTGVPAWWAFVKTKLARGRPPA